MKLLLTGSSGFLGNIFFNEWKKFHDVYALGRSVGAAYQYDLTEHIPGLPQFDMVVHVAGKAHSIPHNQMQAREFYDVNVKGTLNLLKALEASPPNTFVFISSVAVYGNDSGENIDETFPMNATDPYGKSKIEAEKAVLSWGKKNGVHVIILRLPLIAGPNPPGNLGSMIKAIRSGYYFRIGKGDARRSVVNAFDVAKFIPKLHSQEGVYNLVGQNHPTIAEIDTLIAIMLRKKIRVMPDFIIKITAYIGDLLPFFPINSTRMKKLTTSLTFSAELATQVIGWNPMSFGENSFGKAP